MAIESSNPNIKQLSPMLKEYVANIYDSIGSFESAKTTVSEALKKANQSYSESFDLLGSSGDDQQIKTAKDGIKLISEAASVLNRSMDGDVGQLLADCKEVNVWLGEISDIYAKSGSWSPGLWEKIVNAITKLITSKYSENDQGNIDRANQEIERIIKLCEAKIASMQESTNAISLGIIGNMKMGGSLGAYTGYSNSFSRTEWEAANPIAPTLNILQQAGCFAVGAVEGVLKFGEGIVDAGASLVGGVISLFGGNSDGIKDFIATDWSKKAAGGFVGLTSGITGISEEAYYQSAGRTVGKVAGTVIAVAALTAVTGGAATPLLIKVAVASSVAGTKSESVVQGGGSIGEGIVKGAVVGGITYLTFGLGEKFMNTGAGKAVSNVISKAMNTKVMSVVKVPFKVLTWPARTIAKAQAKVIVGGFSAIGKGAVATGSFFQSKFGKFGKSGGTGPGTGGPGGVAENAANPAKTQPEATKDYIARRDQLMNDGKGSLGSDGKYYKSATSEGAPTAKNTLLDQVDDAAVRAGTPKTPGTGTNPSGGGPGGGTGTPSTAGAPRPNVSGTGNNPALTKSDAMLSNGRGSLTNNSTYQPPASTSGAPNAGNTVLGQVDDAAVGAGTGTPSAAGAPRPNVSGTGNNPALTKSDAMLSNGRGSLTNNSTYQPPASTSGAPNAGNTVLGQVDDAAVGAGTGTGTPSAAGAPRPNVSGTGNNPALTKSDAMLSNGRGSLTNNSTYQPPASTGGAPNAGNTVLNQADDVALGSQSQPRLMAGEPQPRLMAGDPTDDVIQATSTGNGRGVINTDDASLLYKDALNKWQTAGRPSSGPIYDDMWTAHELYSNNNLLSTEGAKQWGMHSYNARAGVGTENLVYGENGLQPRNVIGEDKGKILEDLFKGIF